IALVSLVIASFLWNCLSLYSNYQAAKQLGVPIVISPFDFYQPFWQLTHKALLPLFRRLPKPLNTFTRFSYFGWQFDDKNAAYEEFGPAFVLVTPGMTEFVVSDPGATKELLATHHSYCKPPSIQIVSLYGQNLVTVEKDDWVRHRKLTAPHFSERVSRFVWDESIEQTRGMLRKVFGTVNSISDTLVEDCKIIALHVIMGAGLGASHDFDRGAKGIQKGHTMGLGESVFTTLENITIILVSSSAFSLLKLPIFPKSLRKVGAAAQEYRSYLDELIETEKNRSSDDLNRPNLLSAMVRGNDNSQGEKASRYRLSIDEIRGNLFAFSFAGHDTTANVLVYTFALLAVHPEWQDWIGEEVDEIGNQYPDGLIEYEKIYPRLKRCMATMYETLRIYGPVTWIPRATTAHRSLTFSEPLKVSGEQSTTLPPGMLLNINVYEPHTRPSHWGQDSYAFRPSRFVLTPTETKPNGWIVEGDKNNDGTEKIMHPPSGVFNPWSMGPRICVGIKFSQVEFVAVLF
ncbi:cytochrome P450, partial [Eremomyces bilateralis CBS 781.70]